MNSRHKTIEEIHRQKLFAIIRGIKPAQIIPTVNALLAGGVKLLEVTFNSNESDKATIESIEIIRTHFTDRVICGVGTVTKPEQVSSASSAGAQFVVSPNTDVNVIRTTRESELVSIPGALTPTEIVHAHQSGADFVKLFPGGVFPPAYFRAIKAVLKNIPLIMVGSIDDRNALEYLRNGAAGVGVGDYLVNANAVSEGKFNDITDRTAHLINSLHT